MKYYFGVAYFLYCCLFDLVNLFTKEEKEKKVKKTKKKQAKKKKERRILISCKNYKMSSLSYLYCHVASHAYAWECIKYNNII